MEKDTNIERINLNVVPESMLALAVNREVIGKDPYFKDQNGQVHRLNGSILGRDNPLRVETERRMVNGYIAGLDLSETHFLNILLADPNSDTKINLHTYGVEKINIRRIKPMTTECRAVVIIPARFEETKILDILQGYAKQEEVSSKQFEIDVLVNHKIDETPDNTSEVVLQFMRHHPDLNINLVDIQFDPKYAKVSRARKLITDLALLRAAKRESYWSPLYIITEDADVNKIDPKIVKRTIAGFDSKPEIDTFRGRQDRSNALRSQNYLCSLTYKANQLAEIIARDRNFRDHYRKGFNFDWNRVVSGGWGCSFTMEGYALIGGYPENMLLGEDVSIAQLLSIARGHKDENGNIIPYLDVSSRFPVKEESNYLRLGTEIVRGISAYQDDQFADQGIKSKDELEILSKLKKFRRIMPEDPENTGRFQEAIRGPFNFLRYVIGDNDLFMSRYAQRFLWGLGLKKEDYNITRKDQEIILDIANWTNITKILDKYREKHTQEFHDRYI